VSNVLNYGVLEDVGRFGDHPQLVDDLQRLQLAQQPLKLPSEAGDPLKQADEELPADNRGELYRPLAALPQAVEPGHDDSLDGLRNSQFTQGLGHSVVAILAGDETQVEQRLGYFFNKERHPLGLFHKRRLKFFWEQFAAKKARCHLKRLLVSQMAKINRAMETLDPELRRIFQPMRQDQHQPRASDRIHQEIEVLLGAGVGPVHVFEDQNQRPQPGTAQRQGAKRVKDPRAPRRRIHRQYRRIARIDGQEVADIGNFRIQTAKPAHAMLDLSDHLRLAVVLVDAEVLT
jgi:hypothetical protein